MRIFISLIILLSPAICFSDDINIIDNNTIRQIQPVENTLNVNDINVKCELISQEVREAEIKFNTAQKNMDAKKLELSSCKAVLQTTKDLISGQTNSDAVNWVNFNMLNENIN